MRISLITTATRKEAEEALAVACIQYPKRAAEFTKSKEDWMIAFDFYRRHNDPKLSAAAICAQLAGIDFTQGISLRMIPPPDKVVQFQPPTTNGDFPTAATGNYWSEGGVTPEQLGISAFGAMRDPSAPWKAPAVNPVNVRKTAWEFVADKDSPFEALCSKAAPVMDTWSRKVPVLCEAGGSQMYAPEGKNHLVLVPNQTARQVQSAADLYSKPPTDHTP